MPRAAHRARPRNATHPQSLRAAGPAGTADAGKRDASRRLNRNAAGAGPHRASPAQRSEAKPPEANRGGGRSMERPAGLTEDSSSSAPARGRQAYYRLACRLPRRQVLVGPNPYSGRFTRWPADNPETHSPFRPGWGRRVVRRGAIVSLTTHPRQPANCHTARRRGWATYLHGHPTAFPAKTRAPHRGQKSAPALTLTCAWPHAASAATPKPAPQSKARSGRNREALPLAPLRSPATVERAQRRHCRDGRTRLEIRAGHQPVSPALRHIARPSRAVPIRRLRAA